MRQKEKVKTSVFSEYENNENDSISSRQLEYWLKQTAPVVQPKLGGLEWTLMSTNSVFEQDEHTLQRNQTYESLNKQNDQLAFNSSRLTGNNSSAVMKSKSYVNAMLDLQNKIKHSEQENTSLKHSVQHLKEERNKVMGQSAHVNEEMRMRLEKLEPRTKKLEELVRINKMLRDTKEESVKKAKLLQKINLQSQGRMVEYEREVQRLNEELEVRNEKSLQLEKQCESDLRNMEKTKQSFGKLQERNRTLEDMKEKSTTSIIEKYNKSVDMVEELTAENMRVKLELQTSKQQTEAILRQQESQHQREREQLMGKVERLGQELLQKKQLIVSLSKEGTYLKEKEQQTNEQLKGILRKYPQQILQIKEFHEKEMNRLRDKPAEKEIIYVERRVEDRIEEIDLNKESEIRIQEEEDRNQVESQLQFEEFNEQEEQMEEVAHFYQTRSLEKEVPKTTAIKPHKFKPSECHSQESGKSRKSAHIKTSSAKGKVSDVKSRKNSNERLHSNHRQTSKSRSRSREGDKRATYEQEHSFILKSCEPVTQHENREPMHDREHFYYNSASNPVQQKAPYYWEPNEVAEFTSSQRAPVPQEYQVPYGSHDPFELERALLMQANREAIRLIDEQEKCMPLLSDKVSPNERVENVGRMKQIGEQIKGNNERILELKYKIMSG